MDFRVGADAHIPIMFMRDGEPHVPDVGSVKYTVHDHAGAPINDFVDLPITTTITTFRITLVMMAEDNTITSPRRFERRKIVVNYTLNGAAAKLEVVYRITPILNYSITPAQVRSFVGVNVYELPDDDIDLLPAYFQVETRIGQDVLDTALLSGTMSDLAANELIRMTCVLNILPSLKQRVAQEEKNGVKAFARPVIKDFEGLRLQAQERYNDALATITSSAAEVVLSLVLVTQDTDVITGE